MNPKTHKPITEAHLQKNFEKIQQDVIDQIQKYEQQYPDLAQPAIRADDVVQQPIYSYQIHAVS